MTVHLPSRLLHGLEDAQVNFEWIETHWAAGLPGPAGPAGPAGPPGSGGDLTYVHNQVATAATWNVTHNLGKWPSVMIVDSGNSVLEADIHYVDANNLTVNLSAASSGKVYVN